MGDITFEPYRSIIIHEYEEVKNYPVKVQIVQHSFISGSGSTLMNIVRDEKYSENPIRIDKLNYTWKSYST